MMRLEYRMAIVTEDRPKAAVMEGSSNAPKPLSKAYSDSIDRRSSRWLLQGDLSGRRRTRWRRGDDGDSAFQTVVAGQVLT
jgi:hypothetical protein